MNALSVLSVTLFGLAVSSICHSQHETAKEFLPPLKDDAYLRSHGTVILRG